MTLVQAVSLLREWEIQTLEAILNIAAPIQYGKSALQTLDEMRAENIARRESYDAWRKGFQAAHPGVPITVPCGRCCGAGYIFRSSLPGDSSTTMTCPNCQGKGHL